VSERHPYIYGSFLGVAQRTQKPNNATASVQTGQFLESCSANVFSRRRASEKEWVGRLYYSQLSAISFTYPFLSLLARRANEG